MLTDAVAGKGAVAMVVGTVATGKTELLERIAGEGVEHGVVAVNATGARAERDLPLGVMSQLLHDAPLPDDERERALNLLHEGTRSVLAGGGQGQLDVQVVHALCTLLLELADRCPVALLVDDLQDADPASLLCLAYLARRVRYAPVLLLLGMSDFGRTGDPLAAELLRPGHSGRIRLSPLSEAGVRQLVTARIGEPAAARFAAGWHAVSGGNPRLVEALLEDHESTGDGAPGDHYGHAVVSCLHSGGAEIVQVARGVAVLAASESLEKLLDIDPGTVARSVRALTAAGLLADGRFRHPAARSAVLAELDEQQLSVLHSRAASVAYDSGAGAAAVADHLVTAGQVDEQWGVPVLEDAARQALRDGRVEAAVRCLKLAWRACTDEQHRVRIMTTLVRAEWRINPSISTGYLPELTSALQKGVLRGGDAIVLAKALLWHGQFAEANDVLERVAATGADLQPDTVAELATTRPWLRCSYPQFLKHLRQGPAVVSSVAASRRLESATALAEVLGRGPSRDVTQAVERTLGSIRLDEISLDTVESALLTLVYGGQAERAVPWCDTFIEEAYTRRAPSRQARLAAIRSEIAVRLGDLPGAERHARLALRLMPPSSWGVAVGVPLANLILALTGMGRFDEVADQLDQPVPEAMFQTRFGLHYLHARGRYSLATNHLGLALRDFRLCGKLMATWEMDVAGLVPWRAEAAEVYLRMGKLDEARRLAEDQITRCGRELPRVHGMALRTLALAGQSRHRPMLLRQAADLLQSGGDRYELARALVELTEAYLSIGESRRAGTIGRRARAVAEECQAAPLARSLSRDADWADAEGAQAPASSAETAVLSEAERRVAALAAVGYTNREISEKLYVTVSTVEQHLTRTYRKLNVSRRSDLPANLHLDFLGTGS
jgi:DNA-binding CsgD family transcriptional regulator